MKSITLTFACIGVALVASVASLRAQSFVLTLTPDEAQSTPAFPGSGLAGLLNDPFAYDPFTPTVPLPDRTFGDNNSYHSNSGGGTVAFTMDGNYHDLFLDLYGRDTEVVRDNNMTVRFYRGSWDAGDLTEEITLVSIPDSSPQARVSAQPGTEADRFLITSSMQFFTLMELRANGTAAVPEPTSALLLLSGASFFGLARRLRRKSA